MSQWRATAQGCDSAPSHEHGGQWAAPAPQPCGAGQQGSPPGVSGHGSSNPPFTQPAGARQSRPWPAVVLWIKSQFISGADWGRRVGVGRGPRPVCGFPGGLAAWLQRLPDPTQGIYFR